MALAICVECGDGVSAKAVACPHCGADRRSETYSEERRRKGFNNALVLFVVIAFLAVLSRFAHGETVLPVVDVDRLCAAMGKSANWCVHNEQDHYDALKSFEWTQLSEESRQLCLRALATPKTGFYELLDHCASLRLPVDEYNRRQHEVGSFKP